MDAMLVVLGSVVGLMIGLTGVGGGSLLTPLLLLVGIVPSVAIATDLAFAAVTKSVASIGHLWAGTVDWRVVLRLAFGSLPGSMVGSLVVSHLVGAQGETILAKVLGLALILAALATLIRVLGVGGGQGPRQLPVAHTVLLGFSVGTLVGATSVGAGSMLMAALALSNLLPPRRMVGTDIVHGALLAAVAAAAHGWAGRVDPISLTSLLTGALPGAIIGTWLCRRVPEKPLRLGIAFVLTLAGVRLL